MCWRDSVSNEEHLARFRTNQKLACGPPDKIEARIGLNVHVDYLASRKPYYRQDYSLLAFGTIPTCNNEVEIPAGAEVTFTKLPKSVKEDLGVQDNAKAKTLRRDDGEICFLFISGPRGVEFNPFKYGGGVCFIITALPM